MPEYCLSNRAVTDMSDIWHYTLETWSEEQADRYYAMLVSTFQHLAASPAQGKNYTEIAPGLLGFKAGRHLVFYRALEQERIEIVRILHERMDLRNRMPE